MVVERVGRGGAFGWDGRLLWLEREDLLGLQKTPIPSKSAGGCSLFLVVGGKRRRAEGRSDSIRCKRVSVGLREGASEG